MRNISTFVCMSQPVGKHAGSFSFYILNTHPALHIRENRYLHTLQISTFYKMIKNQLFRKPNFVEFSKKHSTTIYKFPPRLVVNRTNCLFILHVEFASI